MRCPTAGYGKGGQHMSKNVGSEKTLYITYIRIHDRKPVKERIPPKCGRGHQQERQAKVLSNITFRLCPSDGRRGRCCCVLGRKLLVLRNTLDGTAIAALFATPKRKGWSKYLPSKRNADLVAAVFTYESEIPSVEGKREGSFFSISLYYFLLPATLPTTRSFVLT